MRGTALLVILPLVLVACGSDASASTTSKTVVVSVDPADPVGTKTYTGLARKHVDSPVEYPQIPPVGGNHSPVWQNCQYYDTSVPSERAVHSMEHGAVWITYSPDLTTADRQALRDLAATGDHILVSQFDGLPSPIVATAWGKQLQLQSVYDPGLHQFVADFESGPQSPERGVTCRGSTSATT